MKNIYFLLVLLFVVSCGSTKPSTPESGTFADGLKSGKYSIEIPENWEYYMSNGYLNYSPKNRKGAKRFQNKVYVLPFNEEVSANTTLDEFMTKRIAGIKENDQTIQSQQQIDGPYGKMHSLKSSGYWNGILYVQSNLYFMHEGIIYNLHYSSSEELYEQFKEEATKILDSFKIGS